MELTAGGETPFDRAAAIERARIVAWAIASLSDRQRLLLVLRYVHDEPFSAIGAALDVSAVAAFHMHARTLARLSAALQSRGIDGLDEI